MSAPPPFATVPAGMARAKPDLLSLAADADGFFEPEDEAEEAADQRRMRLRSSSLPPVAELGQYADKALMHLLTRVLASKVRIDKPEHWKPLSELAKVLMELRRELSAKAPADMTPEERKAVIGDIQSKLTVLTGGKTVNPNASAG